MKKLLSLLLVVGMITSCCCKDNKSEKQCCKDGDKKECCHKKCRGDHDKCPPDKKHCHHGEKGDCRMHAKPILDNILTRVSVRHFTGEKISNEQIQMLLRCAMAAPTAVNKQPWAFLVITEEEMIKKIGEKFPYSQCSNKPACVFVVCGDMTKVLERQPDYWIQDASAATENLLLAAHAMGLGAVWSGVFPTERVKDATELFNLPANIIPFCIVPVGIPAEEPAIKDKWNESNVHYNKW